MKEVIDRARSAMNLILIATILAWWINNSSVDVLASIEPDFASLVQVANEYYTGDHNSSLIAIGNEHSEFVSLVFGNLQFYRDDNRDSLLRFARDHRLSDVVQAGRRLPIDVTILVAPMVGSEEKRPLAEALTRLSNTYSDLAGKLANFASFPTVEEKATILEVHRTLRDKLTVPILNLRVDPSDLTRIFAWAVSLILAFVLSTTFAMHRLAQKASADESINWLFFHPTPLGPILGILWLFSPVAVLVLSQQWIAATLVGALSIAVIGSAIACRLAIRRG